MDKVVLLLERERSVFLNIEEARVLVKLIKVGRANLDRDYELKNINTINKVDNRVWEIMELYEESEHFIKGKNNE